MLKHICTPQPTEKERDQQHGFDYIDKTFHSQNVTSRSHNHTIAS